MAAEAELVAAANAIVNDHLQETSGLAEEHL